MEILNIYQHYEEEKHRAKEYYKRLGRIWCPGLNDYVVFNSVGFRHLMRKGGTWRSKDEQMRRFDLLPYAQKIITDPKAVFITEKRTLIPLTSEAEFFACTNQIDGQQITVIIRQINMRQKHFFSIFAK
jgi:hypothetical protein